MRYRWNESNDWRNVSGEWEAHLPAVHGDGRPEALSAPAHACLSSPVGNVLAHPLDRGAMAGNRQQRQTRQKVRSKECRREFPEAHVGPRGAFAPPPNCLHPRWVPLLLSKHLLTASTVLSIPCHHQKAEALPWLPSLAGNLRFTSGRNWWCYQQGRNDVPGAPCPVKPPPFSLPPRHMA